MTEHGEPSADTDVVPAGPLDTGNRPAARQADELIVEGIVTTTNEDGTTNVAPMGPVVDRQFTSLRLRPFPDSKTYQNLVRTGRGVFHVTDDCLLLAQAAIGVWKSPAALTDAAVGEVRALSDVCRRYVFQTDQVDDSGRRMEVACRVLDCEFIRPFVGWNRAMYVVVEAAILATRVGMLPADEISRQFADWRIVVEKTAGQREREAFELLEDYVRQAGTM